MQLELVFLYAETYVCFETKKREIVSLKKHM